MLQRWCIRFNRVAIPRPFNFGLYCSSSIISLHSIDVASLQHDFDTTPPPGNAFPTILFTDFSLFSTYAERTFRLIGVVKTRGVVMTTKFILALGVGLFVAASSAVAFQDEQPKQNSAPAAELSGGDPAKSGAGGTEVRIPGLGSLGVLPKMDFGLELLYGANDKSQPQVEPPESPTAAPQPDDLTIRGTMKHNF